jgi:two-component system, NarL family, nitrate/nitrite response regulator NarL
VKVLICDDHRLLAEALGTVLRSRGHDPVSLAADPDEAVARVRERDVDVCVMDLFFPRADGIAGISRVLEASPRTRVVVLTGSSDPNAVDDALAAGASSWVAKSEPTQRIVDAIEQARSMRVVQRKPASESRSGTRTPEEKLIRFLTSREREVLERLVAGQTTSVMAREMRVAYSTARTHIQNVLTKLGVHSKLAAVTMAARNGVTPPRRNGTTGGPRPSRATHL